jgi:hypothetical protein
MKTPRILGETGLGWVVFRVLTGLSDETTGEA